MSFGPMCKINGNRPPKSQNEHTMRLKMLNKAGEQHKSNTYENIQVVSGKTIHAIPTNNH